MGGFGNMRIIYGIIWLNNMVLYGFIWFCRDTDEIIIEYS